MLKIHKVEIPGQGGAVELAEAPGGKVRLAVRRKGQEAAVLLTQEAFEALQSESWRFRIYPPEVQEETDHE
jgi:hypothetical protein